MGCSTEPTLTWTMPFSTVHGRVGRAGDDLAHRLTAADDGNARILDLGNDVAAMLANVKLLLHDSFSFSL